VSQLPVVGEGAGRVAGETLPISEVFTSIQGEGKLSGVPSFFVRVSGCNLRCAWCDTPYASWAPEGERRSLDWIADRARESGVHHAVITGGEPMLFDAVEPLSRRLRDLGLHVTIETAGTIPGIPPGLACDLMSMSPKLESSTPAEGDPRDPTGAWRRRHESRRVNPGALQNLIAAYPERQLKFVVCGPRDLREIESLLAHLGGWGPADVLLMPEGVTPPAPETRRWLAAECIRRGWRYCPRLHIELFGNVRGT
jgi:7-carboxy-7-deazaguanine synthase